MVMRTLRALVDTISQNTGLWIGCCAIMAFAATAAADPPTPPKYNAGTITVGTTNYTLHVPAFYPDRDADDRLSAKEVFQFVELIKGTAENDCLFTMLSGLSGQDRSIQEAAVAQKATDALVRMVARPDDFVFPFNGTPFVQNTIFFYHLFEAGSSGGINIHPYDPTATPGDCVRPDGFQYFEPRDQDVCLYSGGNFCASMFSRVSQCMFGESFPYPSGLTPPIPTDINHTPLQPGTPPLRYLIPTTNNGCTPFSLPPSEPMPHGDGPMYCQGEIKFDGGAGPCSMPRPEPGPPEAPDEPLCSSSDPCAPPPEDGAPPPGFEDIRQPPIDTCAGDNACVPDCQSLPCDHGNPDPEPGMHCLGVCEMPKDPPQPKDDSPNPGMDPDAIVRPPLEPLPKEDKTIFYCGGSEGAAPTASMGGSGPGSSPATSCHPVDLVNGFKMEQETDMTFGVTGGDFTLVRNYSTNPSDINGPGLFGRGWWSPLFRSLALYNQGGSQVMVMRGHRPNAWARFQLLNNKWRPIGPSNAYAETTSDTIDYFEPGRGKTSFYATDITVAYQGTNYVVPVRGYIKSETDLYGNVRQYNYQGYGPANARTARLTRIDFLRGGSTPILEARLRIGYYINRDANAPSHVLALAGRVARVVAYRFDAAGTNPIETQRVEYTYKNSNDPFSDDVGTDGDLIQVVKYTRVDRSVSNASSDVETDDKINYYIGAEGGTARTRLFGPGYPHRPTVLQYRYHTTQKNVTLPLGPQTTLVGDTHMLKCVIRPSQIEYFAEMLLKDNQGLRNKIYSTRDAAFRLMLLPDGWLAARRGDERVRVFDLASKFVGYSTDPMDYGKVAVQYLLAGCGCGGSAITVKEDYTRSQSGDGVWKSTRLDTFTLSSTTNLWTAYTTRYVDSKTLSGFDSYLSVHDVLEEAVAGSQGRRWINQYKYDAQGRVIELWSPSACASLTYTPANGTDAPSLAGSPTSGTGTFFNYNADNRVTETGVIVFEPGNIAGRTSTMTVDYSTGDRPDLPVRVAKVSRPSDPDGEEVTTMSYELGTQPSYAVLAMTTSQSRERVSENGPSDESVSLSTSLFDAHGRLAWTINSDGLLTKFEYSHASGKVTKVVTEAPKSELATAGFGAYQSRVADTNGTDAQYETSITYDALARVRQSSFRSIVGGTPGSVSVTQEWGYEYVARPLDSTSKSGVRYMRYVQLPRRGIENSLFVYEQPASLVWVSAAEGTLLVQNAVLRSDANPTTSNGGYLPAQAAVPASSADYSDYVLELFGQSPKIVGWREKSIALSGLVTSISGRHDAAGAFNRSDDAVLSESFEFDAFGRRTKHTSVQGTIQEDQHDVLGRIISRRYGTTPANMKTVAEFVYDAPTGWVSGVGNGLLSGSRTLVDGVTRERRQFYDARERIVKVVNPAPPHSYYAYDNLDRVVEAAEFTQEPSAIDAPLTARGMYQRVSYGQRGLPYRSQVAIDPKVATPSFLESHTWYDVAGRVIATLSPDAPRAKLVYDVLGRVERQYFTDGASDPAPGRPGNYAAAASIADDRVLEQTIHQYDTTTLKLSFVRHTFRRHDDVSTLGDLLAPSSEPSGISMYTGYVYDGLHRLACQVEYGTNRPPNENDRLGDSFCDGPTAPTWPPTQLPTWNGTNEANALVTTTVYNERGLVGEVIDPMGRRTLTVYDDLSRVIAQVENYTGTGEPLMTWDATASDWTQPVFTSQADQNRVTTLAHFRSGTQWINRQTVYNFGGSVDKSTTDSVHGVDSAAISSGDWLSEVRYSSRTTGNASSAAADSVKYTYNLQGELASVTDQRGVVHSYTRDALGRVLSDVATGLNSAIDTRVRRIEAAYNAMGYLTDVRSFGATSGGNAVDHVRYDYTPLWQVASITQDPDSEIGATITAGQHPERTVGYDYSTTAYGVSGDTLTGNRSRLIAQTYPEILPIAQPVNSNQVRYPKIEYLYGIPNSPSETLDNSIGRVSLLKVTDTKASGSTTGLNIAEYSYVGLGMINLVDLPTANVALDRSVDATGRRRYGVSPTQNAAAYPGWDRFGRVKRQAWVAGGYDHGTNDVPNRREHVNLVYSYDRAGNPIFKQNAQLAAGYGGRWADRDTEYSYDGLDRLTLARRGVLSSGPSGLGRGGTLGDLSGRPLVGSSGAGGLARGSQKWTLDALGNWTKFAVDLEQDAVAAPNADAFGGGFESAEERSRTHNGMNELTASLAATLTPPQTLPKGWTFAAAPVQTPLCYAHDDAGCVTEIVKSDTPNPTPLTDGGKHRLIYDAWNRLVEIDRWTVPAAPATADYQILARYDYNGVHQRSRKLAYINAAGQVVAGGPTAQERVYVHNAAWQAVAEIIDDDRPTSGSQANLTTDRIVHQFFGLRGANDALIRREDRGVYHPAVEEVDPVTEEPTGTIIPAYHDPADGIFDNWIAQLNDAQGSIVKTIVAKTGTRAFGPETSREVGRTIDDVEYDPYGRCRRHLPGDYTYDGEIGVDDVLSDSDFIDAWTAGTPAADADEDGVIGTNDLFAFLNDYFISTGTRPVDAVSNAYTDNPYGYCGYYFDVETLGINGPGTGAFYHVRHRVYDPASGRWLTRDPAGFVDGVNLYQYVGGGSIGFSDPLGLIRKGSDPPPTAPSQSMKERILGAIGGHAGDGVDRGLEFGTGVAHAVMVGAAVSAAVVAAAPVAVAVFGAATVGVAAAGLSAYGGYQTGKAAYEAVSGRKAYTDEELSDYQRGQATGNAVFGIAMIGAGARQAYMGRWGASTGGSSTPRGVCFVGCTLVLSATGLVPIEDLRVGDRVETTETIRGEIERDEPAALNHIWLSMPNPDGSNDVIDIEILRSTEWMASTGIEKVGKPVEFTLPEMGLSGPATVTRIDHDVKVVPGQGRLVLATVTHLNGEVLILNLEGADAPLEPTASHRLFSEDRGDWVPARELKAGERLRTAAGPIRIRAIEYRPGVHRVYNIEVATEHTYFVSKQGVLSHNNNPCAEPGPPNGPVPKTGGRQPVAPDPAASGKPHSRVGTEPGQPDRLAFPYGPYRQGFTFDSKGNLIGRTDVTNHGRPDGHLVPHFHPWRGPNGGYGPAGPLPTECIP